jgi:hypothetical protein
MRFMAGDLSGGLVDGIDHSCWPIWRGKHRQPPARLSKSRVRIAGIHDSLCMASFGVARRLDAVPASNAFRVEWFHGSPMPQTQGVR